MSGALAFALGTLSSAAAVIVLRGVAVRVGLADDPSAAPDRKLQARPVPTVGGAAILIGLCAVEASTRTLVTGSGAWIALLIAFALGVIDDRTRGGLSPLALLLGQSIVAATLVASGWRVCGGDPAVALAASVLAVLVALNAVNAFDNADGAATSLGILGLSFGSILLAAPLVGFLPFNLTGNLTGNFASHRGGRRGAAPIAYLGNSGSHLLGVLLVIDPIGRFALLLPVLDLLRLSFVRLAAGSRPWVGDRRHLAHRLQRAGLSRPLVALILIAIAAPAVLGAAASRTASADSAARVPVGPALEIGLLVSFFLFVAVVRFTPRVE